MQAGLPVPHVTTANRTSSRTLDGKEACSLKLPHATSVCRLLLSLNCVSEPACSGGAWLGRERGAGATFVSAGLPLPGAPLATAHCLYEGLMY